MKSTTKPTAITSAQEILKDLNLLRKTKPIVHNVTNFVVMQTCANMLLAIGASPIMAHAKEELSEIVALSNALVINIGTLDASWLESIRLSQDRALERKIPIIFDPVGAGATTYRTQNAKQILQKGVSILRGNASEIMALIDSEVKTQGVDSSQSSLNAIKAAKILAEQYHCTVVVSGETDIIVDAKRQVALSHGTPLFTYVTGMGCAATAIIGAFAAINPDPFLSALHAMAFLTTTGEHVAERANGPSSFYNGLIDYLYSFSESTLDLKIESL